MALDTAHLDLLAALTTHKTLAAASEAINLSPSAASRRLQDAERLVGVTLTIKTGRTIRLTPAGRLVAEAAEASARRMAEAELAARWLGTAGPQPVRIGLGFFDTVAWLLPNQDELRYEVVRSSVRSQAPADPTEPDLVIDVIATQAEGKCRPPLGRGPDADYILGQDELVFVVAADHPLATATKITAADIVDCRYLAGSTDPLPGFEFERFFLPSGDCPTDIVSVNSLTLLLDLVARGEGVTIQPSRAVTGSSAAGLALIALDRPMPVSWAVWSAERSDRRVEHFLQLAGELFD